MHRALFVRKFGAPRAELHLFPPDRLRPAAGPCRTPNSVRKTWDRICAAAGVKARLHDLRHNFCTDLAEAAVPESTMLALMGHMGREMISRYSHIRLAAKRDAVAFVTLAPKPVEPAKEVANAAPRLIVQSLENTTLLFHRGKCFYSTTLARAHAAAFPHLSRRAACVFSGR